MILCCGVMSVNGYECTLPEGHGGQHVAHGWGDHAIESWGADGAAHAEADPRKLERVAEAARRRLEVWTPATDDDLRAALAELDGDT